MFEFLMTKITADMVIPLCIGTFCAGWAAGIVMYRFGQVWKARHA